MQLVKRGRGVNWLREHARPAQRQRREDGEPER
jgi:hypothetical protein